jgi:hypothetical protein
MSSTIVVILLAVIAMLLYRLVKNQSSGGRSVGQQLTNAVLGDGNEFIVEHDTDSGYRHDVSIEVDVDMHWRPLMNHFLEESRFDTCFGKSLYEYRIEGTEVQFRQIEHEFEDVGSPKRQDVRDGIVQESAIRDFYKNTTWSWSDVDEKIAELRRQTEWL